jgi:histidyl-tRNA synthetase
LFRATAEKYGFELLFTPAFESFELLSAKGGAGEAIKDEIYYFKDKGGREMGLRFDFTVPLARVATSNPQLPKPFKRYQIEKVWRYDNPQAMRWREFWQSDIDVVGSRSVLADAECLACVCEFLDKLNLDYSIRVNNRKFIERLLEKSIPKGKIIDVFRAIDKFEKIGEDGVKKELENKGVDAKNVLKIFKLKDFDDRELKELFDYAKQFGIEKRLKFDISLMRGLEYYTSLVFEVSLGAKVSCGGGGRYDNLMKTVGGVDMPATGFSLGLDRILEVIKENKISIEKDKAKIFIATVGDIKGEVIKIAQKLRKSGISAQIDLMDRSLSKQLEYADSLEIPYVLIVGPEEIKKKKYKLRDMKNKTEQELSLENVEKSIRG